MHAFTPVVVSRRRPPQLHSRCSLLNFVSCCGLSVTCRHWSSARMAGAHLWLRVFVNSACTCRRASPFRHPICRLRILSQRECGGLALVLHACCWPPLGSPCVSTFLLCKQLIGFTTACRHCIAVGSRRTSCSLACLPTSVGCGLLVARLRSGALSKCEFKRRATRS